MDAPKPKLKSKGKKGARKKKKKPKRSSSPSKGSPNVDELEDEFENEETDIVFACPVCGRGAAFSVPRGCPFEDHCINAMYICRSEDGNGRCGKLCWHSHPNECEENEEMTFTTTYWCRVCHDEVGHQGCATCEHAGRKQDPDDGQNTLWETYGQPVAGPTGTEGAAASRSAE